MIKKQSISMLLLFLCSLLYLPALAAQQYGAFSYVYIQSDKELPFYVKLEEDMLARFGKNYNIISELAPGPINIEILFQQNMYPPQKFKIQVPENGFRGFILTKKGNDFSLYDIHQHFYLPAGNKLEDDRLPGYTRTAIEQPVQVMQKEPEKPETVTKPLIEKTKAEPKIATEPAKPAAPAVVAEAEKVPEVVATPTPPPAIPAKEALGTPEPSVKPKPPVRRSRRMVVGTDDGIATPAETSPAASGKSPRFMEGIALQNERTTAATATIAKPVGGVVNSDCPVPVAEGRLSQIESRAADKFGEDRLEYLLGQMEHCYSTAQVRQLVRALPDDAARYTLLKRIYSRVTDQSLFPTLEAELSGKEWKKHFRSLIK